jgi:hypothetical protein
MAAAFSQEEPIAMPTIAEIATKVNRALPAEISA